MTTLYQLLFLFWIAGVPDADPATYLSNIKTELTKEWPKNRTINLVFHGHSVPAGYFKTPMVNTLDAYPYQLLKMIKEQYPNAVVNVINTSIGGENSQSGATRFVDEVLIHRPDVLFIDYALNDRRIGLAEAHRAWESMIREATQRSIKVILLTPSPDQRVDIRVENNELEQHTLQIRALAGKHGLGLADSYAQFRTRVMAGDSLGQYMSQVNHPNAKGHQIIARELMLFFK